MPVSLLLAALLLGGCADSGSEDGAVDGAGDGAVRSSVQPTVPVTAGSSTAVPTTAGGRSRAERRLATLTAALQQYGAPGVIAEVDDGEEVWRAAVGDADVAGTPADAGMSFRAASITKPVVAAVTLRLAERGVVDLDEPVAPALPPGALRPDPPVTLRQLLAHTAGVFDLGNEGDIVADIAAIEDPALREEGQAFLAAAVTDKGAVVPPAVAVAAAETHDRYNAPGAGYHYGNVGYQVVGMYLEAVTGRPLAELVAEEAAGPLDLARFTLAPADRSSPEFRGYETTPAGERVDAADDLRAFGNGGNGGVLTTPDDLTTFFQALLGGDVVGADLLADMKNPTRHSQTAGSPYGIGLAPYTLSCGIFYGHEGGVNGTASIALADAAGDRSVVLAFNQRGLGDPRLPRLADLLVCMTP